MRAPFNNHVNLYHGPGTATPGVLRVAAMPCRLVSDLFFQDHTAPLNESLAYFTCEDVEPLASTNTFIAGGKWEFDFAMADRAEFASIPGFMFVVLRTELCTWPVDGAPYWRASIAEAGDDPGPGPTACREGYAEEYRVLEDWRSMSYTLSRIGETVWTYGDVTLEAEVDGPPTDLCISLWRVTRGECSQEFYWDGLAFNRQIDTCFPGPSQYMDVEPVA